MTKSRAVEMLRERAQTNRAELAAARRDNSTMAYYYDGRAETWENAAAFLEAIDIEPERIEHGTHTETAALAG